MSPMNVSLYQAAAAMEGNLLRQQVIAENLAASSVPGFKKRDMAFSAVSADMFKDPSQPVDKTQLQFMFPSFQHTVNFSQGSLLNTGVPTDLSIDGPGFFAVEGPNGQTLYTRDGALRLNNEGQLITKDGFPVLGENGPITIPAGTDLSALTVSSTGEVFAGAEELGSLQLTNFDDPTKLLPFGAGYYDGGTANPQAIDPKETTISQGYTEVANTTPMVEMSQLLGTLRHFEANQRIMKMQDENMGKMIRELSGND